MYKVIILLWLWAMMAPVEADQNDAQRTAADRQRDQTLAAMTASIEKQKTSLHLQKEHHPSRPSKSSDFFVTDSQFAEPVIAADCDPLSQMEVQSLSDRAADANGLSADLIRAVMKQESDFRPCAVSPVGAVGLMQLMPDTAADLGVADSTDAEANVFGGAKLLRKLMDRYAGDLNRTLGAYNAGPGNVDKADGVPDFPETLSYVNTIMKNLLSAGYADPRITAEPTARN